MKTLVVTEKKSVADDFAKVLGGFKKKDTSYERDDMVVAWASGHLLELQAPSEYDAKYKRWALADLPIVPEQFIRVPRKQRFAKSTDLLPGLIKQMKRKEVQRIINACDAGREGELIFNLILDHAGVAEGPEKKPVQRLWLQSMTKASILKAFESLKDAGDYRALREAAYARDEADWMVGMNGSRAFTKKFMGRAKQTFAVGRVKTPTLAFLVDREREIDNFTPVPFFQIDGSFKGSNGSEWTGRWHGQDETGKKADRVKKKETADAIVAKVTGKEGTISEKATKRTEMSPMLFDLTTIQREASSRFGYTLDRTLSIVQKLYEAKKAVTYPRTSSRYLPTDYAAEIPKIVSAVRAGDYGHIVARALSEIGAGADRLKPVKFDRVFNDAKVSDHFAIIPTGENPKSLKEDEAKIYEMIVRRFLAAFLPTAKWEGVVRETTVEGEVFITRDRRLVEAGWRAVEPVADQKPMDPTPPDKKAQTEEVTLLEKETLPPPRYSDGALVKAMETAGKDVAVRGEEGEEELDEETLEELKEKGIGTAATRAAIVKDLIQKGLARRSGRSILATPLGCTLLRIVRNLDLGVLAKPDLTGDWEYRLAKMSRGEYSRDAWNVEMRRQVEDLVKAVRDREDTGGNEAIFAVDHPKGFDLKCPLTGAPIIEKTFSYMAKDEEDGLNISKDQRGKYIFPETLVRLMKDKKVGPLTGFEGTRAPGFLVLGDDGTVSIELEASADDDEEVNDGSGPTEVVPDGLEVGKCPKCSSVVKREGKGYKCIKNIPRKKDKECDFRLAERIKYRYLPLAEIKKMLNGEKTEELFGFVSMRGMKFRAKLYYEEGDLKWEFPPRKPRTTKKKASKKKASKKKATTKKEA